MTPLSGPHHPGSAGLPSVLPGQLPPHDGVGRGCLGGPIGADSIQALVRGDCHVLIDCAPDAPLSTEDQTALLRALRTEGEDLLLGLSLFTLSAYEHDVSAAVTGAMLRQGLITAETVSRLRTALHEAVANALIHGNLELASPRRDELNDFVAFGEAIASRLDDPAYAGRRLSVAVCTPVDADRGLLRLHVRNEGPGFNPAALPPRERRKPDRAHGGWALILAGCDHATFSADGRTLTLTLSPA